MEWLNDYIPDEAVVQQMRQNDGPPEGRVHRAGRAPIAPPVYDTPKKHPNERRYIPQANIPVMQAGNEFVNINSSADMAALASILNEPNNNAQAMFTKASGRYPVTKNIGLGGNVSSDFSARGNADAGIFADMSIEDIGRLQASRNFNRDKHGETMITDSIGGNLGLGNLNAEGGRRIHRGVQGNPDAVIDNVAAKYLITPPLSAIAEYTKIPHGRAKSLGLEYADRDGLTFGGKVTKNNRRDNDKPNFSAYFNKKF